MTIVVDLLVQRVREVASSILYAFVAVRVAVLVADV